ncbi:hypothetical protein Y032_0054g2441 [Ancylostoma ceylanicum]|nr:hypothetical protein Y032_0054g2441 [Ancylostoma ceylanicum]
MARRVVREAIENYLTGPLVLEWAPNLRVNLPPLTGRKIVKSAAQYRQFGRTGRGTMGSQEELGAPELDVTKTERTIRTLETVRSDDVMLRSKRKPKTMDSAERIEKTAEEVGAANVRSQFRAGPHPQPLPLPQRAPQQILGRQKTAPPQRAGAQQRTRVPLPLQQQQLRQPQIQQRRIKTPERNPRKRSDTPRKKRR